MKNKSKPTRIHRALYKVTARHVTQYDIEYIVHLFARDMEEPLRSYKTCVRVCGANAWTTNEI